MASITTRQTGTTGVEGVTRKNLPLTNTEIDNNFISLNNGKLETSFTGSSNIVTLGTVATGTWNATTIGTTKGGTGLTSFTSGGAVYATSTSALTTGTLPVASGGTGVTTSSGNGRLLIGNSSNAWTSATLTGTDNRISVTNASGSITLSTPQDIATSSNVQFGSFGVGTPASGIAGEIRAVDNITAYYSSDRVFKENIKNVENALDIVCSIGAKTFDWTDTYINSRGGEDGYFIQKSDFGVIAQDVQVVFPQAVRTKADGTLAVDYEKLAVLSFEAIKQLLKRIETLEAKGDL
jgi:hypothetical protein